MRQEARDFSRESKFTNPRIYTVMTERYSSYFGLTENETEELLDYYGRPFDQFDKLASGASTTVWLNLDTSYAERESNYSLWGLLVNAYHMLFLGMCMTLRGSYQVSSNLESGTGRSDITLKSLKKSLPNVIIEFKQGRDIKQCAVSYQVLN